MGREPAGVVDLGIRLRDTLYRRSVVLDARGALQTSIRMASRSPRQLLMALPSIDAFIDSWPLGAMVDDAVATWRERPEPKALAVLHRTAEVVGSVLGWPRSLDRRWPLPDEAWMRRQVSGELVVARRGPRDGSAAVAMALDARFGRAEGLPLPAMLEIHGDELAHRVDEAVDALSAGRVQAVDVDGWIPWDDASQAAAERLRGATPLQEAYARYGLAALAAGGGMPFASLLTDAPAGVVGDRMRRVGDAVIVPGMDGSGNIHPVGVLCWDDCHRPVRVNPVAITVLDAIGAHEELDAVAKSLQASRPEVMGLVEQLAEVGAITAVDDG
ncbi:MAG: hypothetical protein H6734_16085 [Alphaproteobacteria bacterium]|nr:hypothetical protein [Alphaproteobacteria bacterium]